MKNQAITIILLFSASMVFGAFSIKNVSAEDRLPGYNYVEEKGQNFKESKRVKVFDPNGNLVGLDIFFRRGGNVRKVYRTDGTLKFSHEVYANGATREHIEYNKSGTFVTERQTYFPNGKIWWEATRKADGNTLRKDYHSDGTLRSIRELFDKNGFCDTTFRKDGSKWYGKERKSGMTGRGESFYHTADGKHSLRRIFDGSNMKVKVLDSKGNELYSQEWTRGGRNYSLESVKEPLVNGEYRVINVSQGAVIGVDYQDASGKVIKSEPPSSLSKPVDKSRLKELAPDDDPTVPRIAITR